MEYSRRCSADVYIVGHRLWAVRAGDRLLPNGPGGGGEAPVRAEGERVGLSFDESFDLFQFLKAVTKYVSYAILTLSPCNK